MCRATSLHTHWYSWMKCSRDLKTCTRCPTTSPGLVVPRERAAPSCPLLHAAWRCWCGGGSAQGAAPRPSRPAASSCSCSRASCCCSKASTPSSCHAPLLPAPWRRPTPGAGPPPWWCRWASSARSSCVAKHTRRPSRGASGAARGRPSSACTPLGLLSAVPAGRLTCCCSSSSDTGLLSCAVGQAPAPLLPPRRLHPGAPVTCSTTQRTVSGRLRRYRRTGATTAGSIAPAAARHTVAGRCEQLEWVGGWREGREAATGRCAARLRGAWHVPGCVVSLQRRRETAAQRASPCGSRACMTRMMDTYVCTTSAAEAPACSKRLETAALRAAKGQERRRRVDAPALWSVRTRANVPAADRPARSPRTGRS